MPSTKSQNTGYQYVKIQHLGISVSFPSELKGKSRVHNQMAVAELVSQYPQEPSVF